MNNNLSEKLLFVIIFFYIIINSLLIFNELFYVTSIIPIALIIAYLAFFKLDVLLFIIVTFVPISIPLRFIKTGLNFDVFLPTEPLIAGVMVLFYFKLILENTFDKKILYHPVTILILINLLWILICTIFSTLPIVSIKIFISRLWFETTFYFAVILLFKNYSNIIKYILCYTLTLIIVIFYSVYRLFKLGVNPTIANGACKPFFADHTSYGAALAIIFITLIGILIINRKASNSKILFYASLIFIYFSGVVLSYTRASWLGILFSIGVLFLMWLKIKFKTVLFSFVILLTIFIIYQNDIYIYIEQNKQNSDKSLTKHLSSISNIRSDDSNLERINRWSAAIRMLKEKPIFGWGPGTYMFKYAPFQSSENKTGISTNNGSLGNAHSEYIGPLAETGFIGALTIIGVVISTIVTASKIYYRSKRRKVKLMALTLMLALISYYIHGILNNFLDTDKISALFWGYTAMIVALDVYFYSPKLYKT